VSHTSNLLIIVPLKMCSQDVPCSGTKIENSQFSGFPGDSKGCRGEDANPQFIDPLVLVMISRCQKEKIAKGYRFPTTILSSRNRNSSPKVQLITEKSIPSHPYVLPLPRSGSWTPQLSPLTDLRPTLHFQSTTWQPSP
jgi:hypothetical protein